MRLEQAVGVKPAPEPLELDEQVTLALDAELGHRETERRRRGGASRIEITAAADDDSHAVGQLHAKGIEVVAPHRAGQRPAWVAQLEVDPGARGPEPPHLADQLDAGELLKLGL